MESARSGCVEAESFDFVQPKVAKQFRRGTHRFVSPNETLERVRRWMRALGITRVANVTGLDTPGIPVVMVCRPNSRSISVSQGKGLTLESAKASGLMEALELCHAERPRIPLVRASYNEICQERTIIDLGGVPRLSGGAFRPGLPLLWTEGRDLLARRAPAWLPFDLVHMDWTLPLSIGTESFVRSSNGLASGNHFLEAASHALCELVERDATTLWHCLGETARAQTRLDLTTVDDPSSAEVLDRFARAGVAVAIWETTTDIGIPAFLCMTAERSPSALRPLPPVGGEGCHPAREIALLRALTEAAQKRLTMIVGSRDDLFACEYRERLDPDFVQRAARALEQTDGARRFADVPTWNAETFDEDLCWELERLRSVGIEQAIAVDLSGPERDFSVVRMVVPGLEGIHEIPGYVAGRRARARLTDGSP